MSIGVWVRGQRDRPIAEHERRTALGGVAVLLCAATLLLSLTQPTHPHQRLARETPPASRSENTKAALLAPQAARAARVFLAGYLAYVYGQAPAGTVAGATPALTRALRAHPPRVPPAMRAQHPRVLALHPITAPRGLVGVSALVNDGGLIDYTVALLLTPRRGVLLVSALEGN